MGSETQRGRTGSHILAADRELSRVEHKNLFAEHLQRRQEQLRTQDVLVDRGDLRINLSDIEIKRPVVLIKPNDIEINPKTEEHLPLDVVLEPSLVEH